MTWDLPFPDGSVRYVFCAHTLEHIYFGGQALRFLSNIHRCLEKGGVIRIIVPDLGLLARAYADESSTLLEERSKMPHYHFTSVYRSKMENLCRYGGTQGRPGDFFGHKYAYDFDVLAGLLREAGFDKVRRCEFQGSSHEALRIDDQCSAAKHSIGEDNLSLYVEATK
jgi:hypothetical protein